MIAFGNTVAVEVAHHGNVANETAEGVNSIDAAVAARAPIPCAISVDDEIDAPVAVDIA